MEAARFLLPRLRDEIQHSSASAVLSFPRNPLASEICGETLLLRLHSGRALLMLVPDICHSELLFKSWFCTACGLDLCNDCMQDCVQNTSIRSAVLDTTAISPEGSVMGQVCSATRSLHSSESVRPATRFTREFLLKTVATMESLLPSQRYACI